VGPIGGAIITIPALIFTRMAGDARGVDGRFAWRIDPAGHSQQRRSLEFRPFTFLNIPKATMRLLRKAELSWEMAPLGACVGLELGRVALVLATKPTVALRGGFALGTGGCCWW